MRILLFGKNGQVGWELQRALMPLGEISALGAADVNLADADALRRAVRNFRPSVVINAAAYTAVDRAEAEPELAFAVNATAPGILAEECKGIDALLVHYSTDYVFDGQKNAPYTEDDLPNPLNVYGKSKLAGEQAIASVGCSHLILRTSWVYGLRGDNFLTKFITWAKQHKVVNIVQDQVASPTWSRFLAETVAHLAALESKTPGWSAARSGVYHLAGGGAVSRYNFAQAILMNMPTKDGLMLQELHPSQTANFPSPAVRPLFSALQTSRFERAFGYTAPNWLEMLKFVLAEQLKSI